MGSKTKPTRPPVAESRLESWTKTIVQLAVVVFVALAARSSLADHYVIPSGSMLPTLEIKDRVFVGKATYGLRVPFTSIVVAGGKLPERGDVAVFRSPTDGTVFIKRIVALPGDEIRVHRGRITLNGHPVTWEREGKRTYEILNGRRYQLRLDDGGGPDQAPITVPEGACFAMGDNRGNSQDSRSWGFLPLKNLRGRAKAIYWHSGEGFAWDPLFVEVGGAGAAAAPSPASDPAPPVAGENAPAPAAEPPASDPDPPAGENGDRPAAPEPDPAGETAADAGSTSAAGSR